MVICYTDYGAHTIKMPILMITWANANNKVTDYDYMRCVYLLKLKYFNDIQSILENPANV